MWMLSDWMGYTAAKFHTSLEISNIQIHASAKLQDMDLMRQEEMAESVNVNHVNFWFLLSLLVK